MRLSENHTIVNVIMPADNEAGIAGDSIHMGKLHSACWILTCGALTGDAVLTVKSGATAGTETTAESFVYRLADADQGSAGADTYANWTRASTLTLTAATYDNRTLIVEMDSDEMTDGQPWATFSLSAAASVAFTACIALCRARFKGNDPNTVIS